MLKQPKTISRSLLIPPWHALPVIGWFFAFLIVPVGFVVLYSFAKKGVYGGILYDWNFSNFWRATDPIYLRVVWNSFVLAVTTTLSCLLIGFPMAFVIATANPKLKAVLLTLVMIPFWTNFVVRAYAIKLFLSESGPLQSFLLRLGLFEGSFEWANSAFSVWLGMLTNYLPFMVLPLFVSLDKFDFTLFEAAYDLGASGRDVFFKILLPLVKPGIITGIIFVFTPALGEFVIPDILGGARTLLIGNLITDQFLKSRDWPFGSALSILLMITVLFSFLLYLRLGERHQKGVGHG